MTNRSHREEQDRAQEARTSPRPQLGPATHAARHTRADRQAARARPYPLPLDGIDATGDAVRLAATRALLLARSRQEIAAVLHTAVNDLGAAVVPARLADAHPHAIPLDVSLGVGEPRVVVVDPVSLAAMRCSQHLPGLVQDALLAAGRCDREHRDVTLAPVDEPAGPNADDREQK